MCEIWWIMSNQGVVMESSLGRQGCYWGSVLYKEPLSDDLGVSLNTTRAFFTLHLCDCVVQGGVMSLVQGSYLYYHYMQDGIDDNVSPANLTASFLTMLPLRYGGAPTARSRHCGHGFCCKATRRRQCQDTGASRRRW